MWHQSINQNQETSADCEHRTNTTHCVTGCLSFTAHLNGAELKTPCGRTPQTAGEKEAEEQNTVDQKEVMDKQAIHSQWRMATTSSTRKVISPEDDVDVWMVPTEQNDVNTADVVA